MFCLQEMLRICFDRWPLHKKNVVVHNKWKKNVIIVKKRRSAHWCFSEGGTEKSRLYIDTVYTPAKKASKTNHG